MTKRYVYIYIQLSNAFSPTAFGTLDTALKYIVDSVADAAYFLNEWGDMQDLCISALPDMKESCLCNDEHQLNLHDTDKQFIGAIYRIEVK